MLEIVNILFKKGQNEIYKNFSLQLNDNEMLTCLYNKKQERKKFLNLIIGKDYPYEGMIKLNNEDITTLNKSDRKIVLIKKHSFLSLFFIPTKLKLIIYSITDPVFIYNSFNAYILKIFDKKILTAKNEEQIKLISNLNEIFGDYIKQTIKNNLSKTQKFLDDMNNLHNSNAEELLQNSVFSLTKKWIKTYLSKKTEILTHENILTFYQILYDIVSGFKELRLSCDCEKKKKQIKNKNISMKDFYYYEINNVVDKQLNLISIEIIKQRYEIRKLKYKIIAYKKVINNNLKKYETNKKIIKDIKFNIINYKKNRIINRNKYNKFLSVVTDLENNFLKNAEISNKQTLPNKFLLLKNKIIELIHSYHKLILDNEIISISKKDYKLKLKELNIEFNRKSEVKNIYSMINNKFETISEELGIEKNTIFSKKISVEFSKILTALLNAIISEKEVIILDKIFDKLSLKEQGKLNKIIERIFLNYPKTKIFIISNNFLYNNFLKTNYLLLTDYSNLFFDKTNLNIDYLSHPKNIHMYKSIFKNNGNINFHHKKNHKKNELDYFLDGIENIKNKIYCLNPLHINFERHSFEDIKLVGKVKSIKHIKSNFYLINFKVNKGKIIKILKEYAIDKNKKIENIYINKKFIIMYNKF